jgi:hypothetical protein
MTCGRAGWWYSPGTPVPSTNKTDHHDISEILLKLTFKTLSLKNPILYIINTSSVFYILL